MKKGHEIFRLEFFLYETDCDEQLNWTINSPNCFHVSLLFRTISVYFFLWSVSRDWTDSICYSTDQIIIVYSLLRGENKGYSIYILSFRVCCLSSHSELPFSLEGIRTVSKTVMSNCHDQVVILTLFELYNSILGNHWLSNSEEIPPRDYSALKFGMLFYWLALRYKSILARCSTVSTIVSQL